MSVTWLIATYNESATIKDKLENCLSLSGIFENNEIIVADNGSTDDTVSIVKQYGDVKLCTFGRIGKYYALYEALDEVNSDWVLLSDANVRVLEFDNDSLAKLMSDSKITLIYGSILRVDERSFSGLDQLEKKDHGIRLRLDEKTGLSSGAYGGLYIVRTPALKSALELPPVQNDDLFIAVGVSCYGKPACGSLYGYEIEDMSFFEEFRRKYRDAQGHIAALGHLYKRIPIKKNRNYAVGVRAVIWALIYLCLFIAVSLLIISPWFVFLAIIPLSRHSTRILATRISAFLLGFCAGIVKGERVTWDSRRL